MGEVQAPLAISGKVVDAKGKAVADARVSFARAPVAVPDIAALTNKRGEFTLSAPAPGRYAVAVAADGYATANVEVAVERVAVEVTVRLRRA